MNRRFLAALVMLCLAVLFCANERRLTRPPKIPSYDPIAYCFVPQLGRAFICRELPRIARA